MAAVAPLTNRVYIVNFAGHDYEAAAKYGEFRYITRGFVNFKNLDRLKYQIVEAIAESKKDDWLLLSGKTLLGIIAALAWYERHQCVKLLIFDARVGHKKYSEMLISKLNLHDIWESVENGDSRT